MKIDKIKVKAFFKEVVETVGFVLIMLIIIKFFLFELRWIPSSSMVPTLEIKDRIVVERVSRFFIKPQRGDIMVFYPPQTELKYDLWSLFARYSGIGCKDIAYIKRVIGMPGDKLEIKKPSKNEEYAVFINDKKIDEPYINENLPYMECGENIHCGPMTIPEKNYFMMGDNRGNSSDSRVWGFLPEENFIGRAVYLFWPPLRMHVFQRPLYNLETVRQDKK